jgi:hypothetical protein
VVLLNPGVINVSPSAAAETTLAVDNNIHHLTAIDKKYEKLINDL